MMILNDPIIRTNPPFRIGHRRVRSGNEARAIEKHKAEPTFPKQAREICNANYRVREGPHATTIMRV